MKENDLEQTRVYVIDITKVNENDERDFARISENECKELVDLEIAKLYGDLSDFEHAYNNGDVDSEKTFIRLFA